MAVPKKRHSRSRQGKRRANWKLSLPTISKCASCGAPKLPHQACPSCGIYRGRPVIKVKTKEDKSQKEKQ